MRSCIIPKYDVTDKPRVASASTAKCLCRSPLDVPGQGGDGDHDILGRSAVQLLITGDKGDRRPTAPLARGKPSAGRCDFAPARWHPAIPSVAAARIATTDCNRFAARLHDRFNLLTRGLELTLRHRNLLAIPRLSCQTLLSGAEARALRHLAVFQRHFSRCHAAVMEKSRHLISVIASQSRIAWQAWSSSRSSPPTFKPGTITIVCLTPHRIRARKQLRRCEEAPEAVRRHAEYFREALIQAEAESNSLPQADWHRRYSRHLGNVRAGLEWAFSADGDQQLGAMLTAAAVPLWVHLSLLGGIAASAPVALAKLVDARYKSNAAAHTALGSRRLVF